MSNTTIRTNDAAGQQLQFVVIPNSYVVIKDRLGNELGNIGIDDQALLIAAIMNGNQAIRHKLLGNQP